MTTHVSKEQLGLMMPGTMSHYFHDEPEYLEVLRPGLLVQGVAAIATWFARRAEIGEVGSPSDAQLADIGISRSEAPLVFDRDFPDRRERDCSIATLA